MSKLYLKNANVIDVVAGQELKGSSILVEDGIIREIGGAAPADAEVLDLGGKSVMPGLFNCHTHICLAPVADPKYDETDAQVTMMALDHLKMYNETGVTYVRDVGGMNFIDIDIRDAVKAGKLCAPDLAVSGKCVTMTGGHGWSMGRECDGADECRKAAREQLKAGADWVKVMATGGVMTKGVEPGSPQLGEDELRAAIEEAHKVGAKTCTHAQGMTGIKNALRAGIDSIEHGFYMDDECFDLMKKNNTFFVPTLAAVYWIVKNGTEAGIPDYAVRKATEAMEAHKDTFQRAYKAGVKIALGTDSGTPFNPHSGTAYELVLMVEAGMTPVDALRAGTIVAAELCGVEKEMGSIEVGKKANLAVFAKSPLEDVANAGDCCMTIKNGKVIYQA
ncbi:MAG: amidohydrolase family protein [Clostridia bacterium]|nr:amidohydrolase family protein [Clostridia bacterium]